MPDAIEPNTGIGDPGQPGVFQVDAAPLTNDLVIYYSISGTASASTDYPTLSGAVTVPFSTGRTNIDVATGASLIVSIHARR